MTTYSAIANSEIAVGAPITNSLMTKIRDNPLAIQENDASAPTIAYAATIGANGVTDSSINWENVAEANIGLLASGGTWTIPAGMYQYIWIDASAPSSENAYIQHKNDTLGTWTASNTISNGNIGAAAGIISDGTRQRVYNGSNGDIYIRYSKLS